MPRGDLIERQWELLNLVEERGQVTRGELARHFGVDPKTIKRDVEVLTLYFPLGEERRGPEVTYSFDNNYRLPPVRLSLSEAVGLVAARELWQQVGSARMARAVERALDKIQKALPAGGREAAAAIRSLGRACLPPDVDEDLVSRLATACRDCRRVQLVYEGARSGEVTERKVDPYTVALRPPAAYLVGFCHLRQEVRVLHLARIVKATLLDELFDATQVDLDRYLGQGFGAMQGGAPLAVEVLVRGPMARVLETNPVHPTQTLEEIDHDTVVVRFTSTGLEGVMRWVLSLGSAGEVMGPGELREAVARELEAIASAHRGADT